jgi:hypothetical protein
LVTAALSSRPLFEPTLPVVAERVTAIAPGVAAVTVIAAVADLFPSATEVAVNVTLAGVGTLAGAV